MAVSARASLALLVALAASPAAAQTPPLPALTAPVNDFAHVIDAASAQALDDRIRALQTATHDAVVVVTVPSITPYGSIEEYAARLFEHAGVGQRQQDNGVLVLLAVNDRQVRIEVGYGLEEYVTDGFSGETIRQVMLPEFRAGHYGPGLLAGTTRVIDRIASARGVTLTNVPTEPAPASPDDSPGLPVWVVILIVLALIGRLMAFSGGRRRGGFPFGGFWGGGWSGGIGSFGGGGMRGGGFGGFGGGMSGGGGASGGW